MTLLNTLRPGQNGRHFPDDHLKCIFLNENIQISINISLKFVPKGRINNIPVLVPIMAWHRPGDKPLSEPMMVGLLTHICITRPQWVQVLYHIQGRQMWLKLEQLERLRSEDTPRRLMITHTIGSYWIPSQQNNRSRTENITERTRFSKSRSNDLEDIGQGQRSSHATHLLMLVIICTKYGKNPSRTVDATERTRFSRSRLNDL